MTTMKKSKKNKMTRKRMHQKKKRSHKSQKKQTLAKIFCATG